MSHSNAMDMPSNRTEKLSCNQSNIPAAHLPMGILLSVSQSILFALSKVTRCGQRFRSVQRSTGWKDQTGVRRDGPA